MPNQEDSMFVPVWALKIFVGLFAFFVPTFTTWAIWMSSQLLTMQIRLDGALHSMNDVELNSDRIIDHEIRLRQLERTSF